MIYGSESLLADAALKFKKSRYADGCVEFP